MAVVSQASSHQRPVGLEAVDLGRLGELDEVFQVGRPVAAHVAAMPAGDQVTRIPVGREKPMQMD
jgi:hypothetical protein